MLNYEYIKSHLRKPTQYIVVKVDYRARSSSKESLMWDVYVWLKDVEEGKISPDSDGRIAGPWMYALCKGDKERCKAAQADCRFHAHEQRSTSRLVQLGMWRETWVILPADEYGKWVPTPAYIKAALETMKKREEENNNSK